MELTLAIAVGVMFGSGVWLILRPRTFQLITGLLLRLFQTARRTMTGRSRKCPSSAVSVSARKAIASRGAAGIVP